MVVERSSSAARRTQRIRRLVWTSDQGRKLRTCDTKSDQLAAWPEPGKTRQAEVPVPAAFLKRLRLAPEHPV
ncbi:hypothetical protein RRG08_066930 [Elysia crispata]|uniref:Uncharacterized protein n=1 Tax=Elysia crispata TaxID=231223 RepID=A0AAE1E1U4_9GAST|nr:hypothetical protein RRG08_066930 [Elysia crispata]